MLDVRKYNDGQNRLHLCPLEVYSIMSQVNIKRSHKNIRSKIGKLDEGDPQDILDSK